MNLSVCIIAKNEEQNIKRCLESLKKYDFEIVVVDTGSTDNTKQIAESYTENVYDFLWCDDFAEAKNEAIRKATNEFVLVLDSDEWLEELDLEKLKKQIKQNPTSVGRIKRRNIMTRDGIKKENEEWINRIFSKKKFGYEGRIHEQIEEKNGEPYETYLTDVVILHSGYDLPKEKRKQKAERNIHLLLKELAELKENDVQVPYLLYQLGKGYYMSEEYITACEYFSKGLSYDLNPKLEYVIDMVETYGYALLNSGQAEVAMNFENIYDEFGCNADFQFLMGLIYMNNEKFNAAISEFLKATTHESCRSIGVNSFSAFYNIGVIYECMGKKSEAGNYYRKCGDYAPAKKRLLEMIQDLRED